jgi:hypothetical protein
MAGEWQLIRNRVAKALLTALLMAQGVLAVNACVLPLSGVSMAYTDANMPACGGMLTKNACLMAFLQADQAPGSDATGLVSYYHSFLAPAPTVAQLSHQLDTARGYSISPPVVPPPRILFCRLLN